MQALAVIQAELNSSMYFEVYGFTLAKFLLNL